ncbi:hypothetical protein D3C76_1725880 [compost metagenome]
MQRFRLIWQQAGKQGADHTVGIEFVECRVGFDRRHWATVAAHRVQGKTRAVLLTAQAAGDAMVKAQTELDQVLAQCLALALAYR